MRRTHTAASSRNARALVLVALVASLVLGVAWWWRIGAGADEFVGNAPEAVVIDGPLAGVLLAAGDIAACGQDGHEAAGNLVAGSSGVTTHGRVVNIRDDYHCARPVHLREVGALRLQLLWEEMDETAVLIRSFPLNIERDFDQQRRRIPPFVC